MIIWKRSSASTGSGSMPAKLVARRTILINAPASRVWQALTDPGLIKKYLFGTEAVSDWKEGSPIVYKGVWRGKPYEDKGRVVRFVPGRLLQSTYWSSLGGLEDKPENYATVTYALSEEAGRTRLSLTQDNISTEEERDHSERNWSLVLEAMKKLLEE
jgi:uncharacterized protein YndB with AHSA1/START domain